MSLLDEAGAARDALAAAHETAVSASTAVPFLINEPRSSTMTTTNDLAQIPDYFTRFRDHVLGRRVLRAE
jgi:hypothetical protein